MPKKLGHSRACTHAHTPGCMYTHTRTRTHVRMHACMLADTLTQTQTRAHNGAIHYLLNSVISMIFLEIAHSLIFRMLKNSGKSWKILFTLIIPTALNFSAAFQRSASRTIRRLSVVGGLFWLFSWASSPSYLSCSRFAFGFIGWTRVSHGHWANGFSLSCRCWGRWCCSKKEIQSPESYLYWREDGCFLVSHAGRRDDDRVLQSN